MWGGQAPAGGTLAIKPGSGHVYLFDAQAGDMKFEVASKNYFHGTDVERNPDQTA